jgi:hypothetical protein
MGKMFKCTTRTISNHVKTLIDLGVLKSKPINSLKGDRTNFYALNPSLIDSKNIKKSFSPPMMKKMRGIIEIMLNLSIKTGFDVKNRQF